MNHPRMRTIPDGCVVGLLVVYFYALLFGNVASTTISSVEYNALHDLFNSTTGSQWILDIPYTTYGYPWNFVIPQENPCSITTPWQGITCSSGCYLDNTTTNTLPCNIISINLQELNLQGTLPQSIGNLSSLQSLTIRDNGALVGSIPSTLGKLSSLIELDLDSNFLSSSIPSELGNGLINLKLLDLDSNYLTGTIPTSILCGEMIKGLQTLYLYSNGLTGTLSSCATDLHTDTLTMMWLNDNLLSGTIPSAFFDTYINVDTLYLHDNAFTGSIPIPSNTTTNITALTTLGLYNNQLTGTIPSILSLFTSMSVFQVLLNQLTGIIPIEYGNNWLHLQVFDCDTNYLTGPLPDNFGNFTLLDYLDVHGNLLSNTIPSTLSKLSLLSVLLLANNIFTGTIPDAFGEEETMLTLTYLDLFTNLLTGTIPSSISKIQTLNVVFLQDNFLTGTIPNSLSELHKLIYFELSENLLTGTIPAKLGGLTSNMKIMYFYSNLLTGTIPSSFGESSDSSSSSNDTIVTYLQVLDVSNNELTGVLPCSMGNFTHSLSVIAIAFNQLTGTIPSTWHLLELIQRLIMNDNYLTGQLPSSYPISTSTTTTTTTLNTNIDTDAPTFVPPYIPPWVDLLPKTWKILQLIYVYNNLLTSGTWFTQPQHIPFLQTLDMSNNILTGSIVDNWFINSTFLQSLNLNTNGITGSLPSSLFINKRVLSSVILSANCFSGTLPPTICDTTTITQLIFDGLHSQSICTTKAISFIPNGGIIINNGVYGTLSSCLFQLPYMRALHLGGNSFSGTLPNIRLSDSLEELILSSNILTGLIPMNLWNSNLTNVDLSLNRLQGTLPSNMLPLLNNGVNVSVKLNVNQLSGIVPSNVINLPANAVNVLEGNMFSCNAQRSNLPYHDPKYESYNCGSDSTNYALILFACAIVVLAIGWWSVSSIRTIWKEWLEIFQKVADVAVISMFHELEVMATMIAVFCIGTGLILFGALSVKYSSYTNSYVWSVSAIYSNGILPAVLTFVWLLILVSLIVWRLIRLTRSDPLPSDNQQVEHDSNEKRNPYASKWWLGMLVITINVVVVVVVNAGYVSAVRSDYTLAQLLIIAFSISLFKIVWSNLLLRGIVDISDTAIVSVSLFNNLVAPCLAELFVSSDCFLYVVSQPSSLSFSYGVYGCALTVGPFGQIRPCQATSEYIVSNAELLIVPPFHYSNQCSFSLISSYSYVFIFRYVLSGLIAPFIVWIVGSNMRAFNQMRLVNWLLPPLWRSFDQNDETAMEQYVVNMEANLQRSFRQRFISTMVADLSLLIGFGAMFPPLALLIALSIVKDVYHARFGMGRLARISISNYKWKDRLLKIRHSIQRDYLVSNSIITRGVWCGLCISSVIWAFVLFDVLSSSVGSINSVWIVILMVVSPFLIYYAALKLRHRGENKNDLIRSKGAEHDSKLDSAANPMQTSFSEERPSSFEMVNII